MGLFGETCVRCGENRATSGLGRVPTCEACAAKIRLRREKARRCPVDSAVMKKDIVHNVVIDRCSQCGGIWLDPGELAMLQKAVESDAGGGSFAIGFVVGMAVG